ncbi:TldD/PmbA family protein [Corallincola spongiicola]|uniref:TldD/PmbA family protein n=1 Tax=Corallincola spongiicola TaxID=2520508 RepID=A0ABY1WQP8_9GAMM|nr:TldD/PmbA family protein [Corallincola spongiicola]TAA47051.1 TldD/PmbA family protein [Corallincola spongiicola]
MSFEHLSLASSSDYIELRQHESRNSFMMLVDGNLIENKTQHDAGLSARVFQQGYWGFASAADLGAATAERLTNKAFANAKALSIFGDRPSLSLPQSSYQGEHHVMGKTELSRQERSEWLNEMHQLCAKRYPKLVSSQFMLGDEYHRKFLSNSVGSQIHSSMHRAECITVFTAEGKDGQPIELHDWISGKGGFADLDMSMATMEQRFEQLYQHLMAKCDAVPVAGGKHTVVMASELTGLLAHEAMGHPCEADIVLGGAITSELLQQPVASELITMVDFAHSYAGQETLVPVYADDEGTPATDAILIDQGVLTGYMHSRESSAQMDMAATGNARAANCSDEPLIRMRNTAILPGKDKYAQMISEIESGYLLLDSANGQADSTSEFMFGICLGYEIKNGKLGRAIKDTTVSGSAIEVLKSVDAVSDEMTWECKGHCGKKQWIVVSAGGPAIRATAHLGGE